MRDSLELIRDLSRQPDSIKVLAFGVDEMSSDILGCAEAGAAGYVTPDASLEDLVEAIERIAREELACSLRVTAQLFKRIAESNDRSTADANDLRRLTTREADVLELIRRGKSNEIAVALNNAVSTVKNHVHHVPEKLAVTTRAQAAAQASSLPPRRRYFL